MKNVLIVDDSKIMRNIVKNTFSLLNISCRYYEADDGENAFNELEGASFDLVLLDWNMPRLLGIDFLKRVRDDERFSNIPIIMVTSEAARANVIEALKNGANDYIIKPVNEQKFREKVSNLGFASE
ncbi:MAG: response regulator [Spirochaetia bacterium]|jgi:two-component system chemotaxis response regulator CheY|nr:response regulator [Spirochaetia bacterium]